MKFKLFFIFILLIGSYQNTKSSDVSVKNESGKVVDIGFESELRSGHGTFAYLYRLNPGESKTLFSIREEKGIVWRQFNSCPKKVTGKCAVSYQSNEKVEWLAFGGKFTIKSDGKYDYDFGSWGYGRDLQAKIIDNECHDC